MENSLYDKRENYAKFQLTEKLISDNPMELFRDWYFQAEDSETTSEVNAMVLTTVENFKVPRSRKVLLKRYTWEGFYFFSNYESRKAQAIQENPEVCLFFHWETMERQVIIQAKVEKIPENLSDGYFSERPRGSQIGAIISPQSKIIPNREFLEEKYKLKEEELKNQTEIQRPDYWGGYLAKPYEIEFWQGRPNRLHDRIIFQLQEDFSWKISRLAP